MNPTDIKVELISAISKLSSALEQISGDDIARKNALGNISIVTDIHLTKVRTAINNLLHPEGTEGYISVDENGLPIEKKDAAKSEESDNETADASLSSEEEAFNCIKTNFPAFEQETLYRRYAEGGIETALDYLLAITGTRKIGPLTTEHTNGKIIYRFKVADGIVAENHSVAEDCLAKIVNLTGAKLDTVTSSSIDDGAREFKIEIKDTNLIHTIRLSPLGSILASLFMR